VEIADIDQRGKISLVVVSESDAAEATDAPANGTPAVASEPEPATR
jgi:polyribonucleotide nucleotidyltransferase